MVPATTNLPSPMAIKIGRFRNGECREGFVVKVQQIGSMQTLNVEAGGDNFFVIAPEGENHEIGDGGTLKFNGRWHFHKHPGTG